MADKASADKETSTTGRHETPCETTNETTGRDDKKPETHNEPMGKTTNETQDDTLSTKRQTGRECRPLRKQTQRQNETT